MTYRLPRSLITIIGILALAWSSIWQVTSAIAAPSLTIAPITWDVVGLDSNNVTTGPDTFMVGARVCNTGSTAATNVVSNFVWDSTSTYINLNGASTLSVASLAAGACTDFYYNVVITRNSAAYNKTSSYHITAVADTLATISTPTPRQLYVEKLVSQNRNTVASVSGPTSVVVGQTYQYVVNSSTATGGYEQLEAFLNFPNVMFQLISVASTYTAPTGGTNDKVYADACTWDNLPTSPTYRSCLGTGKAGGTIVTTYTVKILSPGTATLTTLIYDFSGSSYHYNDDFGTGVNSKTVTSVAANADLSITKTDSPDPVSVGGTLIYNLAVTNLGPTDASSLTVSDSLPASVSFISASGTGWACSQASGTVTCTRPSLAVGAAPTISIVVAAPAVAGPLTNNASVSSTSTDPVIANNSASATTTVQIVPGAISGIVYNDLNGDGIQNGSEGVLGGVTIELLNSSGSVIASTTTNALGAYSFSSLTPGSYTVRETDPNGYTSTTANSVPVNVVAGGTTSANFGDQQKGTISGTVFNDLNGNGLQDGSESGIGGVTIELIDSTGTVVYSVITTNGAYQFTNVLAGNYTVRENDLTGYTSTTANSVPVNVASGGSAIANFGDQQVGTISGMVFNDLNGDGLQDGSESGLGGVTIQLLNSAGTVVATTTTTTNGAYQFMNVPVGNYTVRETDPSGYTSTTANSVPVNVTLGGAANANFGDQQQGTISGTVFSDLNGDGTQDTGEGGLGGVTIQLLDSAGSVVAITTTAGNGSYLFSGLAAGSYIVREIDPAGYTSTTANSVPVNVAPGGAANANFGDQQQGTVSGTVFSDLNGNGTPDVGEGGLGGVTIQLLDSNGTVIATATTAGNGSYVFTGVTPGSYTVREIDPTGYISTSANNVPVSIATGGAANANFGDQQQGTISGTVFSDLNGDGVLNGSESGLGGVTIELLDSSGTVVATTSTAGNGSYLFSGVTPGNYTVRETDATGYVSTSANSVPVNVAPGGAANANFGDQQQGTISGTVFSDLNGDRAQNAGEGGLGGVTIELVNSSGTVVATTTTAGNGSYLFSGVTAGNYTVHETDPSGYASTTANTVPVSIVAGGAATANFGDQQQSTISGTVFSDLNGDGTLDTGEIGIGGVTIELVDANGIVIATTTTLADGSYSFTGVVAGNYTVRETDPSGYSSTTPNTVALSVGAGSTGTANFGDRRQGSVSGSVFKDLNGNGTQDTGESGLGGVTIQLLDSNGTVIATTTTAGDGSYIFTGVTPGSYTVRETDPTGYVSTTPNTVPVTIGAGGAASANFGDQQQGSVSGTVFSDLNANGTQGSGEGGIGGVTVQLINASGTIIATTTTAGDGSYLFTGVPAGNYTVREIDPFGLTSTTPNSVPITIVGNGAASANFGDRQVGTVTGRIFLDANGNGVQDPGEDGIAGVQIILTDSQGLSQTVTTDANGNYTAVMLVGNATFSVVTSSLPPDLALTTNNQQQAFLVGNGATAITGNVGYHIAPTAVALVSFTATWQNGAVVVRWATAAEMNTWGFYLYRSADATRTSAIRVTPSVILGKGHNQGGGTYVWTDTDVTPGQKYSYWLQEVELNGATNEYGPTTSGGSTASQHQLFLPLVTD